jgi:autotransporter-associated beta strand protein
MKKSVIYLAALLLMICSEAKAQRHTDQLGRGLVAMQAASGNFVSWRRQANELYGVTYNLYRGSTKIASGLSVTNYNDTGGNSGSTYQVEVVVNGVAQAHTKCDAVGLWNDYYYNLNKTHNGYLDIALAKVYDRGGNDVTSHYQPNDAEMADLDGDGELEIIIKRLNTYDAGTDDGNGGTKNMYAYDSKEFVVFDAYNVNWQTGAATLMWRIDCGPNMVSLNSTEVNIIAYDWDEDGKAEVVLRGADDMLILGSDGKTTKHTIGTAGVNKRDQMQSHTNAQYAWTHRGNEYLVYINGETGALYQQMTYPLKRFESGETVSSSGEEAAWGDNYGHRSSKYFMGAPFLDGRKASLFLGRGIYTRHKMMALDLNKGTHEWSERWSWSCNDLSSPWCKNGYHNFVIADVDEDGRDEIVYGSMVIDDNGKGLSTTGFEHGDAQHVGDFDPYRKGLEFFGCLEDAPYYGSNYRNATTSEVYYKYTHSEDDGRAMMGNFSNAYPGCLGRSVGSGLISSVKDVEVVPRATADANTGDALYWSHLNFRIFWDGDLRDEILDSPGTAREAAVYDYESGRLFTSDGCNMNNDSKNNACFQGDIIGDWREEIIVRCGANLRVYTTGYVTEYSLPCLWYDHQYRQAMVWQMMAYNQPPHPSFFVGEMEGITQAPPPLTNTGRTEIANGGSISSANTTPVMLCETNDMNVSVGEGAAPGVVYVNTPSWVQGTDENGTTGTKVKTDGSIGATNLPSIETTTYSHTLTGNAFTGSTSLVKQGDGLLALPNVTETYTGNTDVWAGSLAFSGTLSSSPVWMNRHTKLYGAPTISKSLTMEYGSTFYPSAAGVTDASTASYANANISTLNMHEGSRMVFQINPANSQSDRVNIGFLNLRTRSGAAWENYGPEYLKPVIQIVANSSFGGGNKFTLGTLDALTVNGAPVSESNETPVSAVVLEGAGEGKLYFYNGELVLFFEGASWDYTPTITLLSEDYESYAVGNITSTMQANGWTFQSRNSKNEVTIKQGTSPNATKYFDFYYPDGGASRNQRWDFGVGSSLDADNWTLSFSAALNPGTQNSANKFYITGTKTGKLETANDDVTNPLFALKAITAGSTVYKPTFGATAYDEEYTLTSGTWYKFVVRATEIDAVNNTATIYVKITSYDGGTTILEKTVENLNTSAIGKLRGLCWNSPRGASRLNLDDVVLTKKMTSVPATITAVGWATLYTPYALDFTGVDGLTAYTATCTENVVTLTPVDNVPANTGVVLKGAANTYSIPLTASSTTAQGHLKGSATAATAWNAYDGYNLYVLTSVDNGANVQFNPVISGSIAAGKAFLKVNGGASSAHAMNVVFADDVTGISEAKAGFAAKVGKFIEDGKLMILKKGMKFNANGQLVK